MLSTSATNSFEHHVICSLLFYMFGIFGETKTIFLKKQIQYWKKKGLLNEWSQITS
jgi:hypothetical protein